MENIPSHPAAKATTWHPAGLRVRAYGLGGVPVDKVRPWGIMAVACEEQNAREIVGAPASHGPSQTEAAVEGGW
jgi:hypothetical protein